MLARVGGDSTGAMSFTTEQQRARLRPIKWGLFVLSCSGVGCPSSRQRPRASCAGIPASKLLASGIIRVGLITLCSYSQSEKMLGSWKEIASYLGKGVRTVQRWEHQFGLPVRRPNAAAKGVVCALPEELDEWFVVQWGQRNVTPTNGSGDGNGAHNGDGLHPRILAARQLRGRNQQLMTDLMQSARDVAESCEPLGGRPGNHSKPGNGS